MLFFFFKQKTAYEMRISDWSSDVCSSDLLCPHHSPHRIDIEEDVVGVEQLLQGQVDDAYLRAEQQDPRDHEQHAGDNQRNQRHGEKQRFERGVDRKRVVKGKRVSVSVETGGGRILKKKKPTRNN